MLNWPGRQHEAFFAKLGEAVVPGTPPSAPPGPPPETILADLRRRSAECGVELLV